MGTFVGPTTHERYLSQQRVERFQRDGTGRVLLDKFGKPVPVPTFLELMMELPALTPERKERYKAFLREPLPPQIEYSSESGSNT